MSRQPPRLGICCADVVSGFYSFLGFTRLTSKEVVQKGIAEGIEKGVFGYFTGSVPALDGIGKYQVARSKVRFSVPVTGDEIDLESGFLMIPQSIPEEAPLQVSTDPVFPVSKLPADEGIATPELMTGPESQVATERSVHLSFTASRDQLYTAWNAIVNLADMAGKVEINIGAKSEAGFDKSKLQNGVFEPLREADLIE